MLSRRNTICAVVLALALFAQACQHNFALDLRLVLAASGPLIESLNLGPKKGAVIADFTDLANGAATLADKFKTCGASKVCKLDAVSAFESTFEMVAARGHFGLSPKLLTVEGVLKGIIASAKIYFGGGSPNARMAGKPVTEDDIKGQIKALEIAMQP